MTKPTVIKNLALSGGGFYGYAEVGVLRELENYTEHIAIETIKAVSVGSMVAALYAVGYTADELTKIIFEMNFDNLIRDTNFSYYNLYGRFGMYEADRLEKEIERLIQEKVNIKNCTFSQIKKNLIIIATNLNYQCAKIFGKDDTPRMIISKAVRMSIGYPGYITPVLFEGDLYGDGGEFMNYPITTFSNLHETIGITFAAHNENIDGTLKQRIPITCLSDYVKSLALTLSRALYVSQITPKQLDRSIVVHIDKNISSMQFNLTKEEKEYIYQCGIKATKSQINKLISGAISD